MEENSIKIRLPEANVIKIILPVLSLVIAVLLFIIGKDNYIMRIGAAIALGIGIKGIVDVNSKQNKANEIYNKAIKNMEKNKLKDTLNSLEEGLKIDRTNPYINYGLIMINYEKKNFNDVLNYIDNVDLKRIKKGNNILLDEDILKTIKSVALFESKQYEKTIDFLVDAKDSENLYKLLTALSLRESGQLEKSVEILESGLIKDNQNDELAFNYWLGVNLYDLDRIEESRELLEKIYKEDKNYADIREYIKKIK